MVRRMVVVLGVAAAFVALGSAANAATSDRIERHQTQIKAKIACHRAQMRGQPCAGQPGTSAAKAKPAAAKGGRLIEISIAEQRLRAWEGNRVAIDTAVSTGARGTETPTGRFAIQSRETMHWSTRFGVWMPYAMRVVGGIFIHELPLTADGRRIGSSSIGRPVSHGCIRVPIGTARRLYDWTTVGTPVVIR